MAEEEKKEDMCDFDMNFPSEMSGQQWVDHFWSGEFLPWAEAGEVEKFVIKYFPEKAACGRKDLRILFPMCGTSSDMRWVADQGNTVVGVEFAPKAGPLFARNQKLTFTEEDAPALEGKIFSYKESNVKMYCCDWYAFNKDLEGQFDIIWDSAAFVAANQKDKQKYADQLATLLKPDGKLFIYGIDYEDGVIKGPPFPFRDEHCKQFFGAWNMEFIDKHVEVETYDGVDHDFSHILRMFTLK